MKEISNEIWYLDDNLFIYWNKMKVSYSNLWRSIIFEIDLDILREIRFNIIGTRK